MSARASFDYAILRVVPRVEREEFFNVGVVLFCLQRDFLEAQTELHPGRLAAFAPGMDVAGVEEHLAALARVCRGGKEAGVLGLLSQRERFHWVVAPRSTILQASAVHSGLCVSPEESLAQLLKTMVRNPVSR